MPVWPICLNSFVNNKLGTAQVGDISKGQRIMCNFFGKKLNKNLEKNENGIPELWKRYIRILKRYIRTKTSRLKTNEQKKDHSEWSEKNRRAFFL